MNPSLEPRATELEFIEQAAKFLERPSLVMKLVNQIGKPIELVQKRLPEKVQSAISRATQASLEKALTLVLSTLTIAPAVHDLEEARATSIRHGRLHLIATGITGAIGGFFGLASLPFELPITTGLMLRSIAKTAATFGSDLSSYEDQLECLYVLSLGSAGLGTDITQSAYYTSRLGVSSLMRETARYLAAHTAHEIRSGIEKGTAPHLIRFLARIAGQFSVPVSEKMILETLPVIGAFGGAAVNTAFTNYFNDAARFHFGLRKLEREYGQAKIQAIYQSFYANKTQPNNANR